MADSKAATDGRARNALVPPQRVDPALWAAGLFGLATVIAVVDFLVGDEAVLIPVLIVPVTIAAARGRVPAVRALGVYCVALALLLGVANDFFLSMDHVIRTSVV